MSALLQPSFERLARPRYRALVVDDERLLRRVLTRTLTQIGFDVEEASNGQIALGRIHSAYFDLVVSDVRMPVMGGLDLLEAIARDRPQLPVILMSASSEVPTLEAARALGAVDFLRKPFSSVDLQKSALLAAAGRHGNAQEGSAAH